MRISFPSKVLCSTTLKVWTGGALIPGTGGLRKIRWQGSGRGKRGGIRAIYYWAGQVDVLLMLLAYPKNEREDLTPEQKKILATLVREEFK